MKKNITIAVAGNPNSGKSTLINAIAGTRLHVGNWPGVTVEKKEALFDRGDVTIRLVDLPGTYSLSPYTQEEIVARDYLVRERPDAVIDVVDATNLERNFYLTIQLMELGIPMVVALNIHDEALKKGYRIDVPVMEEMLGVRVVPTVATGRTGLAELIDAAANAAVDPAARAPRQLNYGEDLEAAAEEVSRRIRDRHPSLSAQGLPLRWFAFKAIEQDVQASGPAADVAALTSGGALDHLREAHGDDMESHLADVRYGLAGGIVREVLKKPAAAKRELTERIDAVVLNRALGIPIFLAAMWVVFKLTFDVSKPFADWLSFVIGGPLKSWAERLLNAAGAADWVVSLVTEGVIAGVGSVLVFVPVIFAMMFFITFLEGSGYMARAAFVMDRAMHAVGLHGKSFIPLLLGFGCNVPGIYATRTLENPRDKVLTALLIPLMSCGARLPVYVVFIGAFFASQAGAVLWTLYVLGIALAIVMGAIFKRTLFRGEAPMFIMELPPYRMPSGKSLAIHTWEKGKHFLIKAGTYILAVSVLVWFLLNLPWGVETKKDSYLGQVGQVVAPVLAPLGFGTWEAASSLISGIIAKEIVVGTMGEVYAAKAEEEKKAPTTFARDIREIGVSFAGAFGKAGENVVASVGLSTLSAEEDEKRGGLKTAVRKTFTPLSAFAFSVFVLLYMPCVVVAIAMRQEFGTWKWFGVAFVYQMGLAWIAAFIVYQGGKLFGWGG